MRGILRLVVTVGPRLVAPRPRTGMVGGGGWHPQSRTPASAAMLLRLGSWAELFDSASRVLVPHWAAALGLAASVAGTGGGGAEHAWSIPLSLVGGTGEVMADGF